MRNQAEKKTEKEQHKERQASKKKIARLSQVRKERHSYTKSDEEDK